MKRFMTLLSFVVLSMLLTACLFKSSVELTDVSVTIGNDKNLVGVIDRTEGDKKGDELVPTALYYEFMIKNVGIKKLGKSAHNVLTVKIEPNDPLVDASNDIIGFNIYNQSEYDGSGLGTSSSYNSDLKIGEEGKFTLHYDLGVDEKSLDTPFLVPSKDQLEKLHDHALDVTLIVFLKDKEIARFDLQKQ